MHLQCAPGGMCHDRHTPSAEHLPRRTRAPTHPSARPRTRRGSEQKTADPQTEKPPSLVSS